MSTLEKLLENSGCATVFLCDLRRLKKVNDTLGTDVGDALLQLVALRLSGHAEQAKVARFSDAEFAVVSERAMTPAEIHAEGQTIIAALSLPFEVDHHRLHMEVSVGAASGRAAAEQLVSHADLALFEARKCAGTSFRVYDADISGAAAARRRLNEQLRHATNNHEWELYYQPQVRLEDRVLIGLEALLRWHHPERGLIGPADFIAVLERHFGAERVGLWILDEACRQLRAWRDEGFLVPRVAINLFPSQFNAPSLETDVLDALRRQGLQPTDLELEITEKIALGTADHAEASLRSLADKGLEISFDDFGTGFASLSSLKQLPITRLKIDKSFVQDVTETPSSAAVVGAVLSIGRSLGVDVIAEGVETELQRTQLLALGCSSGQGFLFGAPMPAGLVRQAVTCIR